MCLRECMFTCSHARVTVGGKVTVCCPESSRESREHHAYSKSAQLCLCRWWEAWDLPAVAGIQCPIAFYDTSALSALLR